MKYEEYKDSGVLWIGKVPKHWGICRLKNYCSLKARIGWKGLRSEEFEEESYAYLVTGQDFGNSKIDWSKCYQISKKRYNEDPYIQLENGDLLITKDGTIGKIAIVDNLDKPACLNSGVFVLKQTKNKYDTNYLYWALYSTLLKDFNIYTSSGTTILHLYQNVFEEMPLIIPLLVEQQAIAAYLDEKCGEINRTIDVQKKKIDLLNELKQTIITDAVTKGLDPNVPMKDSGVKWIGKIPIHWNVMKLKYSFKNLDYMREPISAEKRERINPIYDYYGASGVIDKIDNYNVDDTVLLIGEDGANLVMRNLPLIYKATGKFWVNNHAHILKPQKGNSYDYMAYLLEMVDYTTSITGSAQPKLSQENLGYILLCVPPLSEQQAIASYLDEECAKINSQITKANRRIELLEELKQSIITEAVTGKIKVC